MIPLGGAYLFAKYRFAKNKSEQPESLKQAVLEGKIRQMRGQHGDEKTKAGLDRLEKMGIKINRPPGL